MRLPRSTRPAFGLGGTPSGFCGLAPGGEKEGRGDDYTQPIDSYCSASLILPGFVVHLPHQTTGQAGPEITAEALTRGHQLNATAANKCNLLGNTFRRKNKIYTTG